MQKDIWPRVWPSMLVGGLAVLLAGCATPTPTPPTNDTPFLKRPSKSGTIAITSDDKFVVQVNPEDDSISIYNTATDTRTAKLTVGDEPSSVVIHPDNKTAFVTLRGDAKVVKIKNIDTNAPSADTNVDVGSEPTGIAMSPCGDKLVVTEFAQGRVVLLNSSTLTTIASKAMPAPRAVAISNNGDTNCNNEKVVVTEFYGRVTGTEATDNSRTGAVKIFNLTDLSDAGEVTFDPVSPGAFVPTSTAPNQLASVAIAGNQFFVTAVAASPDGIPKFNENVFPLLLIGNLNGTKVATISLADEIKKLSLTGPNFLADLYDIATVGDSILYLVSRGGDAIQRVVLQGGSSVSLGTPSVKQIELLTAKDASAANINCQNPIGMVTPNSTSDTTKSYVNCWVSRTTTVVDLGQQKAITRIVASDPPAAGKDTEINLGRRFYFTGRGRWSQESWSSCGSCHPDGLSDNITWRFPAGPRQTTSMDGTFSHGPGNQKQRILNWSAIFDEVHDFERNTRGVSGGVGAIVSNAALDNANRLCLNPDPAQCTNPADATLDFNGLKVQLGKPVKEIQDTANILKDWDEINEFVKTIRPPKGRKFLDATSVSNGRTLFTSASQGNCASCHGGPGWTLSRLFFTPSTANNTALAALDFTSAGHTKAIQAELTNVVGTTVAPAQVACVLRPVGTFGVPGNTALTDALEKKGAANFPRAQGEFAGYNIPSLYGLQVGAPFLHNGQAKTLDDLFNDAKWNVHLLAGNAVFAPSVQQKQDLINFLLSIDASTAEASAPVGADKCPTTFP